MSKDIVLSLDIDGTLQDSALLRKRKKNGASTLSNVLIETIKIAQPLEIRFFFVTSRSLRNTLRYALSLYGIKEVEYQKNSEMKNVVILPEKKTELKPNIIKECLQSYSFANIIKELKDHKIEPEFCTLFDPCLEKDQIGLYYLKCDKLTQYIIELLDLLMKGKINASDLIKLLQDMNDLTYLSKPVKDKNENFNLEINPEILKLLNEERDLYSKFCDKYPAMTYKLHQFIYIGTISGGCDVLHVDDLDHIYKVLGRNNENDIRLFPACKLQHTIENAPWLKENSSSCTQVHCIPFSNKNSEQIKKTLIDGMNLPVTTLQKLSYKAAQPSGLLSFICCSCGSITPDQQMAYQVRDKLGEIIQTYSDENKKEETLTINTAVIEMKQPFLQSSRKLLISHKLKQKIGDIPLRINQLLLNKGIIIEVESKPSAQSVERNVLGYRSVND